VTQVESLIRTLDQELAALARGASLECLVCGEFVQHVLGGIRCPECRSSLAAGDSAATQLELGSQAG
jgi:Zn finger protein HypA/HybF involved in hydrogenase expression